MDEKVARFQLEDGLCDVAATSNLKRGADEVSQSVCQVTDIVTEFLLGDSKGESDPTYFTSVHSDEDAGFGCIGLSHSQSLVKSETRVALVT